MRHFVGHPRARRAAEGGDARDEAAGGSRWRRAGEDPWALLWREVDRSRRHGHELALVRLALQPRTRGSRRIALGAASAVRAAVRSVDVLWVSEDAIFLLLPETDREAAQGLLRRLGDAVSGVAPQGARLACFPQDGLTANALRAAVGGPAAPPTALPAGPARAPGREAGLRAPHEASG